MDWRRDRFPKILFIIGGSGVLHHEAGRIAFRAPSVCVIPEGLRHRLEDDRGRCVSLYGICLKPPSFAHSDLVAAVCREIRVMAPPPQGILPLVKELLAGERLQAPFAGDLQIAIVVRILVEMVQCPWRGGHALPDSRHRVERCLRELQSGFWRKQDIDSAARSAGLSRRRFTQLFRELAGESWHFRLIRLRLDHAAKLLRTTRLSARAVAFESGYSDISHFHRAFRAAQHTTPGNFRKRHARHSTST